MARRVFPIPPDFPLHATENCVRFRDKWEVEPFYAVRLLQEQMHLDAVNQYPDFVGHPGFYYIDMERRTVSVWPMAARGITPEFGKYGDDPSIRPVHQAGS